MLKFSLHRGVVRASGALRVNITGGYYTAWPEYTALLKRIMNETYAR